MTDRIDPAEQSGSATPEDDGSIAPLDRRSALRVVGAGLVGIPSLTGLVAEPVRGGTAGIPADPSGYGMGGYGVGGYGGVANPIPSHLQFADQDDDWTISRTEVGQAIAAFNTDTAIDGHAPTRREVGQLIAYFNQHE